MCEDALDDHISRLEEQVRKLKEFCEWQRRVLDLIYEAWDGWNETEGGMDEYDRLETAITSARSASTMTGTSEEG